MIILIIFFIIKRLNFKQEAIAERNIPRGFDPKIEI